MAYKVYRYQKEKLLTMFNNGGFESVDEIAKRLSWWFEVTRNDQSAQFVVVNSETDKIVSAPIDKGMVELHVNNLKLKNILDETGS